MSFLTKYRPDTLDEFVGHKPSVKAIKALLTGGDVPHAWMFTGQTGAGKTTMARIIAKSLGCDTPQEIDVPSSGAIANIRDIVESMDFMGFGGGAKVYIIDEAHRLSKEAWDVFLKPTEDAPDHAYYFFLTSEPSKIVKAIRNRCKEFDFKPLNYDDIMEQLLVVSELEEWTTIPPEGYDWIVKAADGSMRQALNYLETCQVATSLADIQELVSFVDAENPASGLFQVAQLMARGCSVWSDYNNLLVAAPLNQIGGAKIVFSRYISKCLLSATKFDQGLLIVADQISKMPDFPELLDVQLVVGRVCMNLRAKK
jgi:DNA polymerase III gamma/tau subunit